MGTDFNKWEKQAKDLLKAAEDDDKAEKERSNKALGLEEGKVEGPSVAKSKEEMDKMKEHTKER